MLMRIFTHCLFFQCVFIDFQCVITLLRALSVALMDHVCTSRSRYWIPWSLYWIPVLFGPISSHNTILYGQIIQCTINTNMDHVCITRSRYWIPARNIYYDSSSRDKDLLLYIRGFFADMKLIKGSNFFIFIIVLLK